MYVQQNLYFGSLWVVLEDWNVLNPGYLISIWQIRKFCTLIFLKTIIVVVVKCDIYNVLNSICINLNLFFFLNSWSWQVIQRRSWRMPKSLDFKKFLLYLIHHTLHNGKSVSQSKYNSGFGQEKVNFPWVFFAVVQREFPRIVLIGYQTIIISTLFL